MAQRKKGIQNKRQRSAASVRASISFPADIYEALEHLSEEKKVSLAWVVRDAVERYLVDQAPTSEYMNLTNNTLREKD